MECARACIQLLAGSLKDGTGTADLTPAPVSAPGISVESFRQFIPDVEGTCPSGQISSVCNSSSSTTYYLLFIYRPGAVSVLLGRMHATSQPGRLSLVRLDRLQSERERISGYIPLAFDSAPP